jgi:hypothetical protein
MNVYGDFFVFTPFDMLIQIIFETSVITTVFAIVDMSQLLCEHLFFGRYI